MADRRYDPLDIASLQIWKGEQQGDNRDRIQRLLTNLPLAVEEELTDRERQILRMHFTENMGISQIARELGVNKSTVSRTISRSTDKLFRALRYSL